MKPECVPSNYSCIECIEAGLRGRKIFSTFLVLSVATAARVCVVTVSLPCALPKYKTHARAVSANEIILIQYARMRTGELHAGCYRFRQ